MGYDYYKNLLRRVSYGDLMDAEIRSDWPGISPALVLTFRGEEKPRAVRHTAWKPFLREPYVRKKLGRELCAWAQTLAERAAR